MKSFKYFCYLFLFSCLFFQSPVSASIHYGDCVEFNDDFYGSGYGIVNGRTKDLQGNYKYSLFVSAFLTLEFYEPQLKVVDKKFCGRE